MQLSHKGKVHVPSMSRPRCTAWQSKPSTVCFHEQASLVLLLTTFMLPSTGCMQLMLTDRSGIQKSQPITQLQTNQHLITFYHQCSWLLFAVGKGGRTPHLDQAHQRRTLTCFFPGSTSKYSIFRDTYSAVQARQKPTTYAFQQLAKAET